VRQAQQRFPRRGRERARALAAASVIAVAASVAIDGPSSRAETTEAAQNQIRSALEDWRVAFNNANEKKVCKLFAPDLIANYQGQPERDFASLCELLQTALQDSQTTYRYSLRVDEILVSGEAAVARLVWTLEVDWAGAAKEVIEEPSVDIFRRQADGSWKISRYLAYPATR